jgi:outer membrane protein OmpA-like peptidoglycan-associated protein
MKNLRLFGWILCACASQVVFAQAEKVLEGKDINESALVNALTPEPQMRTRSLKVTREGGAAAIPVKSPSASLLITFETNSAQLTPKAKESLDVVGRALKSDKLSEFRFSIEGHADPRGGEATNLRLSQSRAESVAAYLADTQKIDRARLKPVGKGQSELMNTSNPIAPENRRVTIKTLVE